MLILSEHPKALIMKRHVTLLHICHIRNACSESIAPVMGTWAHYVSYQALTFRRIKQPPVREQSTVFTGVHVLYAFSRADLLVYKHTFSHRQEVMLVPVTSETVAKIRRHWDLILSFLSIPSSHTRRIHSKIEALLSRSDGCSSLSLPSRSRQQLNNCGLLALAFIPSLLFFSLSHFLVSACSYLKPARFR